MLPLTFRTHATYTRSSDSYDLCALKGYLTLQCKALHSMLTLCLASSSSVRIQAFECSCLSPAVHAGTM